MFKARQRHWQTVLKTKFTPKNYLTNKLWVTILLFFDTRVKKNLLYTSIIKKSAPLFFVVEFNISVSVNVISRFAASLSLSILLLKKTYTAYGRIKDYRKIHKLMCTLENFFLKCKQLFQNFSTVRTRLWFFSCLRQANYAQNN